MYNEKIMTILNASKKSIIQKIENYVKQEMEDLCVAHDFEHIQRVVANAKKIHQLENKGNIFIIEAGALLHESLDEKFFDMSKKQERIDKICNFLKPLGLDEKEIEEILFIIENVGFWKSLERTDDFIGSMEFQIVEDADRLEAIWAIAIARCFTYGGKKGRKIYDPNIKPVVLVDKDSYHQKGNKETSFNHFFEKLLLLKDLMHTKWWKKIAKPRHDFMQKYVDEFLAEWNWEK